VTQKITGAELRPGHIFKHDSASHGGRIYEVVEIDESGRYGDRFGRFRQSNGQVVEFYVFDESEYELRDSMPGKRHRMVKVRADDLELVLGWLGEDALGWPKVAEAVNRMREAAR
jgi:hypothetical protein